MCSQPHFGGQMPYLVECAMSKFAMAFVRCPFATERIYRRPNGASGCLPGEPDGKVAARLGAGVARHAVP